MNFDVLIPVVTALVTAFGTYFVAKGNNVRDNEQFFAEKVQEMFKEQSEEIKSLRLEIKTLTAENYQLRIEIVALKDEMQQYGHK